ncbi:MAG: hypothetical protein ACRD2G_13275, partial [Terriglobia bacterium]
GQAAETDVEVFPNGPGQPATPPSGDYQTTITYPDYPYYFPTMDYQRWSDWWGSSNPEFPDDWNTGGTFSLMMHNNLQVESGNTLQAGYSLALGNEHPAATVSFQEGNVETDIVCQGGNSYTFTVPLKSSQSYSIPAGKNNWLPTPNPQSPLAFQGSATVTPPAGASECVAGRATDAYFSAFGIQDGYAGDAAGPGILSTDHTDPLSVRFHSANSTTGAGGAHWSAPVTVKFSPTNCPAAPFSTQLLPPFSVAGPPQDCQSPPY